ncbi:MAG: Do family serine endopeptidase [bacterium]|nr:Do family serine endopeptidase [bacterium]
MKRLLTITVIAALVFAGGIISATLVQKANCQTETVKINGTNGGNYSALSFRELAKRVTPAVVHITSESTVKVSPFFPFNDPFFRDFFKDMPEYENKNTSMGTGFIFDKNGYIVTNNHVIRDAKKITIKIPDGREFSGDEVEIVGTDDRTDIAVLKIKNVKDMPFLEFGDSDEIEVGDWVMAAGNPFGFDGTITVGVISAKNRSNIALSGGPVYQDFIQTDASINPGNSGGPLVDLNGNVIAVNSAIASPSGGNVGIGFGIPSNMVVMVINQLRENGVVSRGYLGIMPQELTGDLKEKFKMDKTETGILVAQVEPETPASKAGLREGDVILEFNGKKMENVNKFRIAVAETPVGKKVNIVILRDGAKKTIVAEIGKLQDETAQGNSEIKEDGKSWLGIAVEEISNENKSKYSITSEYGVVITGINSESPVLNAGIRTGDVIIKIESDKIANISDYKNAAKKYGKNKDVLLTVKRGNTSIWVVVKTK